MRARKIDKQLLYLDSDDQDDLIHDFDQNNDKFHAQFTKILTTSILIELILISVLHKSIGVVYYPIVLISLMLNLIRTKWSDILNCFLVCLLFSNRSMFVVCLLNLSGFWYLEHSYKATQSNVQDLRNLQYKFKNV